MASSIASSEVASASGYAIGIADVRGARERIAGRAHVTPVLTCTTLDQMASAAATRGQNNSTDAAAPASASTAAAPSVSLFFKCENFQKIGAFKYRGAMNAVRLALAAAREPTKLVLITHSSGNHAQALALAARECNLRAVIVMPANTPQVKLEAVRGYGAEVVICESTQAARETAAAEQVALHAPHAIMIPPYDHAWVMAGQGTLALELLEQAADLDALIVPVGGGGMLAGVCIAAKAVNPNIRIYAAEPLDADDCYKSLTSGVYTPLTAPTQTVADGLRTSLGHLTYPILRDLVSGVIVVPEAGIISHMRLVFERMKLVIEPSAAVGVAAAMSTQFHTFGPAASGPMCRDNNPNVIGCEAVRDLPIRRIGIVLCGGNVSLDSLPWMTK